MKLITLIIVGSIVIAVPFIGLRTLYTSTQTQVCFTATDTERKVTQDSSKWIVLTDTEAYENTDSLLFWKFNSSTLQGKIEEGKSYNAEVVGWRVPFLSMYQNILSVEEVESCNQ